MKGFFVTGTDTGVGKTFVSCALAQAAVSRGARVLAFKPIETGCLDGPDGLVGEDQELLAKAAGNWQRGPLRGVYRYRLPAAPNVAANAEGGSISLDEILETFHRAEGCDLAIVEGAGGWRVPITRTEDMSGLARRLGLPVIVVARAGLGTINHSLLTVEAIERDGLTVAALVLSARPEDDLAFTASNAEQIQQRWSGRVLGVPDVPLLL